MAEALLHPVEIGSADLATELVLPLLSLLQDAAVMHHELGCELQEPLFPQPKRREALAIEPWRAEALKVNAIQDRLQDPCRAVIGLHRVGEDELATGLEDPCHLGEHPLTVPTMENRILGPHDIEGLIRCCNRFEAPVDHFNAIPKALGFVELAGAFVLLLTQIQTDDLASIRPREAASGSAVARAQIEHARVVTQRRQQRRHALDRATAGVEDGVLTGLVQPHVDVFATPDDGVEIVGVITIVVVARNPSRFRRARRATHEDLPPKYRFSATWT